MKKFIIEATIKYNLMAEVYAESEEAAKIAYQKDYEVQEYQHTEGTEVVRVIEVPEELDVYALAHSRGMF